MKTLDRFASVISAGTERLKSVDDLDSRATMDAWSKREELGHLIDSAINNYGRLIRAQREQDPQLPGYEQDAWVERQGYEERDWRELITLWSALNAHMLHASRRVPASAYGRKCKIGGTEMTLEFVIEDYIDHMVHHLGHIGVAVNEFRRAESAYA